MAYDYKIGTTVEELTLLSDLGITANPRPTYQPFSTFVKLADGTLQGYGFPIATWHWDVMKPGWSDILAAYLGGNLSATVYIRTRLNRLDNGEYDWATFRCQMNWPSGDEEIQSRRNLSLTIEFTHLEVQS